MTIPGPTTPLPTSAAPPPPASPAVPREPADALAAAVLTVDGVAGLHGGMFGEVATYLPGRRVSGVELTDAGAEVHLSVHYGRDAQAVAAAVRAAAAPLVTGPVDVVVEDVVVGSVVVESTAVGVADPSTGTS